MAIRESELSKTRSTYFQHFKRVSEIAPRRVEAHEAYQDYWLRLASHDVHDTPELQRAMDEMVKFGHSFMVQMLVTLKYSSSARFTDYFRSKGRSDFAEVFVSCFPHAMMQFCIRNNLPNIFATWKELLNDPRFGFDLTRNALDVVMLDSRPEVSELATFLYQNVPAAASSKE